MVTLAHLISIIHLHPPRCCFFFLISFLLLQKHLLLHAHTQATAHTANTYIENTPKAFSVCDAATGARTGCKQQGVWKRRGRCVGRPYAFHQGLMKTHAHTLNHTQYCHIKKKINKTKQNKINKNYLSVTFFCFPLYSSLTYPAMQKILCGLKSVHNKWQLSSYSKSVYYKESIYLLILVFKPELLDEADTVPSCGECGICLLGTLFIQSCL